MDSNLTQIYFFILCILSDFFNIKMQTLLQSKGQFFTSREIFIMEQLKQKLTSLKYPSHFILYCLTFTLYAAAMTGVGPFIPYLADATQYKQTQYSYLFFCRSAGFFTGSLLLKSIQHRIKFHSILMTASILVFISMVLFTCFVNFLLQGLIMFFISTFISIINILVNVCVAETQRTGDVNFWMHILHGSYGIGGLISPIIIYAFKLNSYMVIGTLMLALVPFYLKLQTPEQANKNQKQILNSKLYEHEGYTESSPSKTLKKHFISKDSEYLLCFLFWTYIGIELGFANWISSYAVIENVAAKQQSLTYNSMFWISMTIFRFFSSLLPFKAMRKLMIHESLLMAFVASSVLMIFVGEVEVACMFSSISFGMCFSAMYPLFLSLPSDYGLEISSSQMANIALWSALGEATLALSFGLFMEWMGANTLFYVMFLMVKIVIFMTQYLQELYVKDSRKGENSSELKQMLRTN